MPLFLAIGKFLLGGVQWLAIVAQFVMDFVKRNPWQALCIALVALSALLWLRTDRIAGQRDRALATVAEMHRQSKAADKSYRATEKRLADNARSITKEKNDAIADLVADRNALLEQLRTRPRRPATAATTVATNGQAAPGCTGAQLYRDDSEFLAREASLSDEIRISLKACYAQYDDAREKMQVLQDATPVNP
ncbi:hypothetical protein [Rhizorhapis sp.]|uniref:hypothetical protein n=1 Tax=Rhizorhapis sp. TaxID=1968842 RepID=UPI002B45A73C|nr:hypothetical protein [Rhizorhapis sp.]HKR17670.1 hypothetical protein [Rhizorhapis sp.]